MEGWWEWEWTEREAVLQTFLSKASAESIRSSDAEIGREDPAFRPVIGDGLPSEGHMAFTETAPAARALLKRAGPRELFV